MYGFEDRRVNGNDMEDIERRVRDGDDKDIVMLISGGG